MLTFKNITVRNAAMLRRYYENCDYALCEYSAGVKLMWRSALRYAWAEAAGCLIIRPPGAPATPAGETVPILLIDF